MAKKISRVLASQRDYLVRPFALVNHTHPADYPPQVADIAERDAISGDQRYEGVIIYVQSDQTTYQLRGGADNTDWQTLVTVTGVASHTTLGDIGTNTHIQIDNHITDVSVHFLESSINITESQISNLQSYSLVGHNHDASYLAIAGTAVAANALTSATTIISVSAADEPLVGQVLTATSNALATWQFPPGASNSGDIVQTGTPSDTFVGYFTADKNLSGDAGFTWITASVRLNLTGTSPVLRLQDSDTPAATMTAKIEFFDSTALIGEVGFLSTNSGDLSLKNTAGAVRLDTDGTADVVITGDGNIAIGGYIDGYAGTPVDGALLTWVDANTRAEFILAPTGIQPTGTPVDNQIIVFDGATSADGDPNFTWDQVLLTVDGLKYNNANDQMVIGGGDLTNPGISIDGSATATPYINLQQGGTTRSVFRFNDTLDRTELSSTADEIALRPGNVDRLILTSTLTTLTTTTFDVQGNITLTGTVDGVDLAAHAADTNIHYSDAPADSFDYIRNNNAWVQASYATFGEYVGVFDASGGVFPAATNQGDWFNCTIAGTVDSQPFVIGDTLIATIDSPSTTIFAANWSLVPRIGVNDHTLLTNIGTNTHAVIDTHISDTTLHFTEGSISIPLTQGASDVTATAAEVNLLDLSGLTVNWVLSADTATTASWKAPTSGGAVDSVFGRTGVVVALQADYDGFFLTPAEGDAVYLAIGAKAADSDLLDGVDSTNYARTDINETFSGDVIAEYFKKSLVADATGQGSGTANYWYKICDVDIATINNEVNMLLRVYHEGHNTYAQVSAYFRNVDGGAAADNAGVSIIVAHEKSAVPTFLSGDFKIIQTGTAPSSSVHNYELWGQVGSNFVGPRIIIELLSEAISGSVTWAGANALIITAPTSDYGSEFTATKGLIIDTEGNINLGTRDIEVDGATLDLIEASATADQTAGEIEAIVSHDNLIDFVTGEHFLQSSISITLSQVSDSGTLAALTTVGTTQIDNDAVTFAKMQNIPTANFLGRITASTGNVQDLTGTQATSLLNNFTNTLKGLAPLSGGGTANFLRADGSWVAPPSGGDPTPQTLTDAANISWNISNGESAEVIIAGNRTMDNPTNMVDGGDYVLRVIQDSTGDRILSFGTAYQWPNRGVLPVMSTIPDGVDEIRFRSDGTFMYGVPEYEFSRLQIITINGGSAILLTSVGAFTALDKTKAIEVNLTGNFTSTAATLPAFDCGNLSTWYHVKIIVNSGCIIYGDGGEGGDGEDFVGVGPVAGVPGGYAFDVNVANSSNKVEVVNSGIIRGGGGGGGGANRSVIQDWRVSGKSCIEEQLLYAPGGGGGGGAGQNIGIGGAGPGNAGAGTNGSATGAGIGGIAGNVNYDNASCTPSNHVGYPGRNGGASGAAGQAASNSAASGAAGYWVRNHNNAEWPSGDGTKFGSTHN